MKENQRIRLSKQLLQNSLIALLAEKSIHKLSIREICEKAGINRTTFYKYYGSQYDLLKDIESQMLLQIESCLTLRTKNSCSCFTEMLSFFDTHSELSNILLNNNVDPEFPEKLMNLPRIHELVTNTLENKYTEDKINYIYGFICTGALDIVKSWMNKKQRESPREIALFIDDLIKKFL